MEKVEEEKLEGCGEDVKPKTIGTDSWACGGALLESTSASLFSLRKVKEAVKKALGQRKET